MSFHLFRKLFDRWELWRSFHSIRVLAAWSVLFFSTILFPFLALQAEDNPSQKIFEELVVDSDQKKIDRAKVKYILGKSGERYDLEYKEKDKDTEKEKSNQEILQDFLRRYFLARMTKVSNLNQLPQMREEVREKAADSKGKSDVMDAFNQITSGMMHAMCNGVLDATTPNGTQKVIVIQESVRDSNNKLRVVRIKDDLKRGKDKVFSLAGDLIKHAEISGLAPSKTDFHPAVKLNAMLVLRDLNDKQPQKNKPKTASPRTSTQLDLVAYLESIDGLSDILLVGALSGIERHVDFEQDPSRRDRIAKVVTAVIDLPKGTGRSDDAVGWIRRQAVDILGKLRLPGEGDAYVEKLDEIIINTMEPLPLRIAAAEALRKMDLSRLPDGTIEKLTQSLTQLASDACDYEIVEQLRQNRPFSKPRLQHRLAAVRLTVTGDLQGQATDGGQMAGGLMAVATDEDQAALQKLLTEIQKIETRLNTLAATTPSNQVEDLLQESVRGLKGLQVTEDTPQPTAPQTAENP
ncbi:MAG: hypothetical protein P8K78_05985 [Pirellulales bacterium]|nr:hypothetical protein [Pirellulales bacterium]